MSLRSVESTSTARTLSPRQLRCGVSSNEKGVYPPRYSPSLWPLIQTVDAVITPPKSLKPRRVSFFRPIKILPFSDLSRSNILQYLYNRRDPRTRASRSIADSELLIVEAFAGRSALAPNKQLADVPPASAAPPRTMKSRR